MSFAKRIQKIPMRRVALFTLALLFTTHFASVCTESTAMMPTITYPETKRVDVVEEHFGQKVADPYRWLEKDIRNDKEVAAWVESQNKVTNAYLNTLPGRDIFKERLKQLYNYEQFSIPVKKGGRYFYLYNSGLQNQQVLYVRDSVDSAGRVLIDPNTWAKDGAIALAEWSASDDGKRVVYAVQDGGSDWRTIRVLDVNTGKVLDDEVKWVRFSPTIAWAKDGSGFFYSRFPEPKQGDPSQANVANHAVYFHAIGTPQAQDRRIYATPDQPNMLHTSDITADGRYLTIVSTPLSLGNTLTVVDLKSADWKPRKLIDTVDNRWYLIGNVGTKFFLMTTQDAPRFKVVTMDIAADPVIRDVVPEQDSALLNASLVGGRLLISYMADVKTEVRRYTLDGKAEGVVKLPGIGTAGGFKGKQGDPETFFIFTSFNTPSTIYRYDVASNRLRVWAQPKVAIDLNRIAVEQRFYNSKDGTRIPMFIVRRKDVTTPAPTVLSAYGGYGIPILPDFSPALLGWVEQGGVYAIANIRGGSEYGKAWHEAGRRQNKQNVFDDFIAASEYLKAQGITPQDGLAIQGGSNGGLLIGAVVNQRSDLFAAALPQVGVMDMLRFDQFTSGKTWVDEFGSPAQEADFRNLLNYSPYHNIQSGKAYPAILATTADTDDRVVPGHTFKYVAALQAAEIGDKPHLVRIETRAGHGAGLPTDKIIEKTADMWAFAAHWTGLNVGNGK